MNYDSVLIRFGELALKGKNRHLFETRLMENIRHSLKAFSKVQITKSYGRMYVELNGESYEEIRDRLKKVFGIVSFSPTKMAPLELEAIQKLASAVVQDVKPIPTTFKVNVKRANKAFPHPTLEMNHLVGSHVLRDIAELKVDLHHPEMTLHVEIRDEGVFLYSQVVPGMGGLPSGTSGKVMMMLSGGIDSPVAAWMTMKRGVQIEAVHFHSFPFTSERAKQKVVDLTRVLSKYCGKIRLHVVPFTEIQTQINQHCPESLTITIMRRMMMRIVEKLAHKRHALAISTGESLGQVASQTLDSMNVINKVVNIPVIRPVVAMDKIEIIQYAHQIETYEISILPYEDCCTVFLPKSPSTKPNLKVTERAEAKLDIEALVDAAVAGTEALMIYPEEKEKEFDSFF